MKYRVIEKFRDLKDNERIYEVGDLYEGSEAKKRIAELTSDKNKIGKPLIEQVAEEKAEVE